MLLRIWTSAVAAANVMIRNVYTLKKRTPSNKHATVTYSDHRSHFMPVNMQLRC